MTKLPDKAHPETIAARYAIDSDEQHGAVIPPLYLSSNFSFAGFGEARREVAAGRRHHAPGVEMPAGLDVQHLQCRDPVNDGSPPPGEPGRASATGRTAGPVRKRAGVAWRFSRIAGTC